MWKEEIWKDLLIFPHNMYNKHLSFDLLCIIFYSLMDLGLFFWTFGKALIVYEDQKSHFVSEF